MFFRPGNVSHLGRIGLTSATVQFNPLILFAAGEQGVWYDPSDLSTLFQDSAGTTPVTTVGQPVGRMLDKSGRGNHAFQATAIDRPTLQQDSTGRYYLAVNGTNTWMQTSAISFTASSSMTVIAGVRKASDASTAVVAELSTDAAANNGAWTLHAPSQSGTNRFAYRSKGTVETLALTTNSALNAPITAVVTCQSNIATPIATLRVNGTQYASSSGIQGSGNYGNYVMYLFRRAGTSLPFNGNFYGLIVRGSTSSENEISRSERFMGRRTGVTI